MPAGLGAGGSVGLAFETVKGTYVAPTLFVPVLNESLAYTEEKYYSPQIRQQVMVSEQKQGYYHIEGDIVMEADPVYLPHFLYASRHTPVKTGAADPFLYEFTPSTAGSSSTGAGPSAAKTLSITVVRNGVRFGYTGCVMGGFDFEITDGIMQVTWHVHGEGEEAAEPADPTEAWAAAEIFGANAHSIYVDAAGAAPAFAAASNDFNGFTWSVNHNAEAQNRIRALRSASYVSYGESEVTYNTELDFLTRAEYVNFKDSVFRALKEESLNNGANFAASTRAMQIIMFRTSYDSYEVGLPGLGDLIMANVTGRAMVGGAFTNPGYRLSVKSPTSIT